VLRSESTGPEAAAKSGKSLLRRVAKDMGEQLQEAKKQTAAIELAGVCKSFGSRVVLEGISLSVARGEGLCVCGANAAGKTTLLRIIAGLLQPGSGAVQICGFDMRTQAREIKPMLGAILHKSMVYPQLTVVENLRFFSKLYGVRDSKGRIEELLEQAGLGAYRDDRAGVLSRGMTQRLAIARAMEHNPSVLLADEPFAGLDAKASKHLVSLLRSFKDKGGAILVTTHNVDFALRCCESVAVLEDHKLIFNARVSQIDTAEFARDYLSYARATV